MNSSTSATPAGAARAGRKPRKSVWPAKLDWLQSASGLALGLFMWGHMFFVSSILLAQSCGRSVRRTSFRPQPSTRCPNTCLRG